MGPRGWIPEISPARVVLVYLVFGTAWILLSDQVVSLLTNAAPTTTLFQSAKGVIFVSASAALIYPLLRYRERQVAETRRVMSTMSQESQVLQRILRHNIRNDLNVITGQIDLVEDDIEDTDVLERLQTAQQSADDLLRISEKVRTIEGIQLTDAVPEPVDVVRKLGRATDQLREEYPEITIEEDVPERALAEAGPSLRYAILEIMANSIEHFEDDLEDLRMETQISQTAGSVELTIRDNGPGIPEHEVDAFERRRETPLNHSDGIGLWLVAWIMDMYRGRLSIDTESTPGTTVTCTLQRASA